MRSVAKTMGWLCLLLTVWLAIASVAHYHANASDSATCTVCIASHSSTAPALYSLPKITFVFVSTIRAKFLFARQDLLAFELSVRSPPSI
jgi:hypothetical protein